jgi:hypothetical protein
VGLYIKIGPDSEQAWDILGPGRITEIGGFTHRGASQTIARALMPCELILFPSRKMQSLILADAVLASAIFEELIYIYNQRVANIIRALTSEEVSFPREEACPAGHPTHILSSANTRTGEVRGLCQREFPCSVVLGKGCPLSGRPAQEFHTIWPLTRPAKIHV